jgi:hypothetical protein
MDATERRLVWIIVGMAAAFVGVFILLTYIPAEKLRWLWGE